MMPENRGSVRKPDPAPRGWRAPCTEKESTLHQLSPYIGKLKSLIAHDLIAEYSKEGELVADVFCGSGTVALEAVLMGRRAFASDASQYAITLTKGKLAAPSSLKDAYATLDSALTAAQSYPVDLRSVPRWVRTFYHPRTLKETLQLLGVVRERRDYFLTSCLLGIAHHQRPGFLSYPSSHLVPYLRSNKFPKEKYPEMYEYRDVAPRLRSKVERAMRRSGEIDKRLIVGVRRSTIERLTPPGAVDCYFTSPPYMNALDYQRDNRLRHWLLSGDVRNSIDTRLAENNGFRRMMAIYAKIISRTLVVGGHCILMVGEKTRRKFERFPSEVALEVIDEYAPGLRIKKIIADRIPDVRRSRRNLDGVKREHILIYERYS